MIDASHCKVHPHAAGAVDGNQYMSRTKGDSIPKFTLPWMRNGMPVRILITEGTRADCKEAVHLIDGLFADFLLAGIKAATHCPSLTMRVYDKHLYKLRHLVENAFLHLKHWRGIATRYAKNSASFLAAVQIHCIALCCAILT